MVYWATCTVESVEAFAHTAYSLVKEVSDVAAEVCDCGTYVPVEIRFYHSPPDYLEHEVFGPEVVKHATILFSCDYER